MPKNTMITTINILLIIILTLVSGYGDAKGFYYASKVWNGNAIVWNELLRSAIGFGVGICFYWIVLKYLMLVGITSPELQTILWFGTTLVGVALLSGDFFAWGTLEKCVGVLVIVGIGWLL